MQEHTTNGSKAESDPLGDVQGGGLPEFCPKNKTEFLITLIENATKQLQESELERRTIITNLAISMEQDGSYPTSCICEKVVRVLRGHVYGVVPSAPIIW